MNESCRKPRDSEITCLRIHRALYYIFFFLLFYLEVSGGASEIGKRIFCFISHIKILLQYRYSLCDLVAIDRTKESVARFLSTRVNMFLL